MKKLNIIFLISMATFVLSCTQKINDSYTLTGFTKNIPNQTPIYLILEDETIDSTLVINGNFQFYGEIAHPMEYHLLIKKTMDFTSIWLEKGEIVFNAEKGKFRYAKISNSESQKENEKLWKPIFAYRKKRDSLSKITRNKELDEATIEKAKIEFNHVLDQRLQIETDFIKNNPNSYVSAYTLDFYAKTFGKGKTQKLFESFSNELKVSSYGKSIKRFLELNNIPKIGEKFIDFEMADTEGKLRKLSDYKGKTILLEFWSSDCGACLQENPNLIKSYNKYKPKGFEIFAVSGDSKKDKWIKAIEKDTLSWINVCDLKGRNNLAFTIYGINGIPDNFLIDTNGIIVGRYLRGEKLNKKLSEIFD